MVVDRLCPTIYEMNNKLRIKKILLLYQNINNHNNISDLFLKVQIIFLQVKF